MELLGVIFCLLRGIRANEFALECSGSARRYIAQASFHILCDDCKYYSCYTAVLGLLNYRTIIIQQKGAIIMRTLT